MPKTSFHYLGKCEGDEKLRLKVILSSIQLRTFKQRKDGGGPKKICLRQNVYIILVL